MKKCVHPLLITFGWGSLCPERPYVNPYHGVFPWHHHIRGSSILPGKPTTLPGNFLLIILTYPFISGKLWIGKMAQWEKTFANKPGELNSSPDTQLRQMERVRSITLPSQLWICTVAFSHTHIHTLTHTHLWETSHSLVIPLQNSWEESGDRVLSLPRYRQAST